MQLSTAIQSYLFSYIMRVKVHLYITQNCCQQFQKRLWRDTKTRTWGFATIKRQTEKWSDNPAFKVRQCMWVWDLQWDAWLRMASVVFLSNIHIHCSSLSSLMPPTTGYFSEDKHFTLKASIFQAVYTCTKYYNTGLDWKTPSKKVRQPPCIYTLRRSYCDLSVWRWTQHFLEQWTLLYSST